MRIYYDKEADVLYVEFRHVRAVDNLDITEDGVSADLDEKGEIVGIEILDASKRMTPEELGKITIEDLTLTMPEEGLQPQQVKRKAS